MQIKFWIVLLTKRGLNMDYEKLEELKKKYLAEVNFRKLADTSGVEYKYDIMVCGGTGCRSCKSKKVQDKLEEVIILSESITIGNEAFRSCPKLKLFIFAGKTY